MPLQEVPPSPGLPHPHLPCPDPNENKDKEPWLRCLNSRVQTPALWPPPSSGIHLADHPALRAQAALHLPAKEPSPGALSSTLEGLGDHTQVRRLQNPASFPLK